MTSEFDSDALARLSPSGADLVQALRGHGPRGNELANYYVGAVKVLSDESNPERYVQSAISVSELLEKFPELGTDQHPTNSQVSQRLQKWPRESEQWDKWNRCLSEA